MRAESLIHLNGLEEPSPSSVHTDWDQIAAVQMFVDAARRFVPQYAVDATNWDDIVLLCSQVGGSPLGLELAAAQLRLRPLHELVAQLNASVAVLQTSLRDMPARHRNMKLLMDATWASLSAEEKQVMRALAVLQGSFSLNAASHIAGGALEVVEQLVMRFLIERIPDNRFALHPILKQYVREYKLSHDQRQAIEERLSIYYLGQFEADKDGLFGQQPLAIVQKWLPDLKNLRLAWCVMLRLGETVLLDSLLSGLLRIHMIAGKMDQTATLLGVVDALDCPLAADDPLYIRLLIARARQLYESGEVTAAQLDLDRIFALDMAKIDVESRARSKLLHGDILQANGRPQDARVAFEEALQLANGTDNDRLRARALSRLTWFLTQSLAYCEMATTLARSVGDLWLEAHVVRRMALSEANGAFYERAYLHFQKVLNMNVWLVESDYNRLNLLSNTGKILQLLGSFSRAEQLYLEAQQLVEASGYRRGRFYALMGLSGVYNSLGEYELAVESARICPSARQF